MANHSAQASVTPPAGGGRRAVAGPTAAASLRWPTFFWARIQGYGSLLISMGVVLTLLYLLLISLPKVLAEGSASPVFSSLPLGLWSLLIVHALTALPPLLIGPFALSWTLRTASRRWHRWIGTVYCACIGVSAITGTLLALANTRGPFARAGFALLGVAWFSTTLLAYAAAVRRNIVAHRRWMIRSYALTLAVVTVRPWFIFGPLLGVPEAYWYPLVTWICWVPNLILAEIYVRVTRHNGDLRLVAG